jgi:hypothetical protein
MEVNNDRFIQEGYELFRLELAYYFKDQEKLRERIIKLLSKENFTKSSKTFSRYIYSIRSYEYIYLY